MRDSDYDGGGAYWGGGRGAETLFCAWSSDRSVVYYRRAKNRQAVLLKLIEEFWAETRA